MTPIGFSSFCALLNLIDKRPFSRILRNFFLFLFRRRITKVLLHITPSCNFRCRYCYFDSRADLLGTSQWLDLIRQSRKLSVRRIGLVGGEPFLYPDLEILLDEIRRLNMRAYIYTNGSEISKDWLKKLAKHQPFLIFKYDVDEEVYRYHTGQSFFSFSDLEENIRLSRRAGLRTMTFISLMKRNHLFVDKMVFRSFELGAFPVFERYIPVKGSVEDDNLSITDAEYARALGRLEQLLGPLARSWYSYVRLGSGGCSCYRELLSVSSSGEVSPCPFLPDDFSFGNVKQNSLEKIKETFLGKREQLFQRFSGCSFCAESSLCNGGCLTYAFYVRKKSAASCNRDTFLGHCGFLFYELCDDFEYLKRIINFAVLNETARKV